MTNVDMLLIQLKALNRQFDQTIATQEMLVQRIEELVDDIEENIEHTAGEPVPIPDYLQPPSTDFLTIRKPKETK